MNPRYSRYYTYIKPILNNKQVKTYSSLVFSLILITIFSVFAIKPTLSTIVSLQKSIGEQQKILDALNTKALNLSEGRKNYENIPHQITDKLDQLIPSKPNLPLIIGQFNLLAQKNQASVSGIQFQALELPVNLSASQTNKHPTNQDILLNLNIQGAYQKLINILSDLNEFDRLLAINAANMNRSDDGTVVLSISARALYIK